MKIRKPIQQGTALVPCRTKGENSFKKIGSIAGKVLLALLLILLLLAVFGTAAHAAGLVDDTVDAANEYSKYPLDNYQLDFYVDSGWDWLPWNWLDGIGKQVMYGLYAITNFIWTISLYLSNATGYLIQEAYSLDFISSTADSIGKNMQTLAGVTTGGLSSEGFYIGFLLILILVVGIYVAYTGLIKRETTKAIHAVVNFVVVFVLSAAFIAYAPDYRRKQRAGQGRNRSGGNRRQGKHQPYHHKDHQPLGNRLLPVHVQYRYLHFCIPAHGDNDFLTGTFYYLRHVPACELPP